MGQEGADTYLIRKASDSDLACLQDIAYRVISHCYRGFLGDETVDFFLDCGAARGYVEGSLSRCSVLVVGDTIIGFSISKGNLIDLMMIDEPHQRKGWGSILLKYNEKKLLESHLQIRLESFIDNTRANDFYLKNGWTIQARLLDAEGVMEKLLFVKSRTENGCIR